MSIKGIVVTLQEDISEEHAKHLIHVFSLINGVSDSAPITVDVNDHINRTRIRRELQDKLWKVLDL